MVNAFDSRNLKMVAVLPRNIPSGGKTILICKAQASDSLQVTLHNAAGRLLEVLHQRYLKGGEDGLAGILRIWPDQLCRKPKLNSALSPCRIQNLLTFPIVGWKGQALLL